MAKAIDREAIHQRFHDCVNMASADLEKWLRSDRSRAVGWKGKDGAASESIGHASGRWIVQILRKAKDDLTDDDYSHMRKVVGFIRRHRAQEPANIHTSRWRYSLMNWGFDPTKEG